MYLRRSGSDSAGRTDSARSEPALLERRGNAWSIELSPRVISVRHSRGMEYLARLLEAPAADFGAVELRDGRRQTPADDSAVADRARIDVTRAIRTAIRRIARVDPELGMHLDRSVRTGNICSYRGSVESPISWDVDTAED